MKSQYFIEFHFLKKSVNGICVRFFWLKYSRLCYKNYILLLLNIWFAAQRTTYNQSHAHHANLLFVQVKVTCLVSLFYHKLQVFKNSLNGPYFGIFNQLLSTQNINVARITGNVEQWNETFSVIFKHCALFWGKSRIFGASFQKDN